MTAQQPPPRWAPNVMVRSCCCTLQETGPNHKHGRGGYRGRGSQKDLTFWRRGPIRAARAGCPSSRESAAQARGRERACWRQFPLPVSLSMLFGHRGDDAARWQPSRSQVGEDAPITGALQAPAIMTSPGQAATGPGRGLTFWCWPGWKRADGGGSCGGGGLSRWSSPRAGQQSTA